MLTVILALAVADLAVAGSLLLAARRAIRPRPARVTALALLLCAGFLIYLDRQGSASTALRLPVAPVGDDTHV